MALTAPSHLSLSLLATSSSGASSGDGWVGTWSPGLGDPTVVGWLTVLAYFVGAYLCQGAFKVERARAGRPPAGLWAHVEGLFWFLKSLGGSRRLQTVPPRERLPALWLGLATMLALLGVNKQLDLQSLFTEIGRLLSHSQGWYAERRGVQALFIFLLLFAGWWALRAVLALARGHIREVRFALLGAIGLVCFVAIRAASFHHVDLLIGTDILGVDLNAWLELGGIACIAAGAARHIGLFRRRPAAAAAATSTPRPGSPPASARPSPTRRGGAAR